MEIHTYKTKYIQLNGVHELLNFEKHSFVFLGSSEHQKINK